MTSKQGGHTPLSPRATRAFEHLRPLVADRDAGMPVTDARRRVCSAGEDPEAVDELLNKGYLYEVEGDVYVT
ncbi:hypothetical protein [Haloferax chudinovii]|uniref:MarR family transcriptional regulator n=1 Tax=Haloferax chudinovii TaxID=1109010 RepID=A0ABD5XLY3_9EURY